jgi:hypothetical protein
MFPLDAILGVGMKLVDKFFPDPEAKAKAQLELMQMQQNGELAQINADIAEGKELTTRLQADMASDSWLSKNIRPISLIAIFLAYFLFTMMSAFGYDAKENYVQLLGTWGQLIFGFYFGSRCLEKLTEMRTKAKDGS